MVSTKPLLFILLAVLAASLYAIAQAEGGIDKLPQLIKSAVSEFN